jgi:hypothetical protein
LVLASSWLRLLGQPAQRKPATGPSYDNQNDDNKFASISMSVFSHTFQTKSISCAHCGGDFGKAGSCCDTCGRVLTNQELRAVTEQQWANALRSLKFYLPVSAALSIAVIWALFVGVSS